MPASRFFGAVLLALVVGIPINAQGEISTQQLPRDASVYLSAQLPVGFEQAPPTESEYLEIIIGQLEMLAESIRRVEGFLADPQPGDAGWQNGVRNEAAAQQTILQVIQATAAPERFESLHEGLASGVESLAEAGQDLLRSIETGDPEWIVAAGDKMRRGTQLVAEARATLRVTPEASLEPAPPRELNEDSVRDVVGAVPAPDGTGLPNLGRAMIRVNHALDLTGLIPVHVQLELPENGNRAWWALQSEGHLAYATSVLGAIRDAFPTLPPSVPASISLNPPLPPHPRRVYLTIWETTRWSSAPDFLEPRVFLEYCDPSFAGTYRWRCHIPDMTVRLNLLDGTYSYRYASTRDTWYPLRSARKLLEPAGAIDRPGMPAWPPK